MKTLAIIITVIAIIALISLWALMWLDHIIDRKIHNESKDTKST